MKMEPTVRLHRSIMNRLDYPVNLIGQTAHVQVYLAKSLVPAGSSLAKKVLQGCESDYLQIQRFFGGITTPKLVCVIAPLEPSHNGTGGAYHYACSDPVLYCDANLMFWSNTCKQRVG
jgi:hypothetical protein